MPTIKYAATPLLALLLVACGGDEANTDTPPPPSFSSLSTQGLIQQHGGTEININTTLQNETLYEDQVSENIVNGTTVVRISSYSSAFSNGKTLLGDSFDYDTDAQQWKTRSKPNASEGALHFTNGHWVRLNNLPSITPQDNGLIFDYGNEIKYQASAIVKDISHQSVTQVGLSTGQIQTKPEYAFLKQPTPPFPQGSKAYYMASSPLKTMYISYNNYPTLLKSLEEFINFNAINSNNKMDANSTCPFQFDSSRKMIVFSNNPNSASKCTEKEQPYEIKLIDQQNFLFMPAAKDTEKPNKGKLFYAINNGLFIEGETVEAINASTPQNAFNFEVSILYNKTAINHLLKYGGLPDAAQLK
jgi:hypothetical protein